MTTPSCKAIVTLKAKLAVPHLSKTIRRERLRPLFAEIGRHRVFTVVAGAGYGKTTLVAQATRHLGFKTVWYRLDPSDRDFITFIHYLIAGFRHHYPAFGCETLARLSAAREISTDRHAVVTLLLKEMEKFIDTEFTVVLDDYHLVQTSSGIRETINLLLQNLGEKIHLVVISREAPQLNLSRLIAGREATGISEAELAFTSQEVRNLYRDIFHIALGEDALDLLCRKTAGWVTGLILFNYMLKGKDEIQITRKLSRLQGDSKIVFNYLEENIYAELSPTAAFFLTRTAILSRLEIDYCNRLLESETAADQLMELEKAHLFTFPFDESKDCYYYHHLFRDFLLAKLQRELTKEEFLQLHGRAARLWEARGEPEEAVGHYLEAEWFDEASRLLNRVGRRLIKDGRLNLFLSYYHRIPRQSIDKEPWLRYLFGRALELSGNAREAIRAFEQALTIFQTLGISKGVGISLSRIAFNYYVVGDFERSEMRFKQLLGRIQQMPRLYVDALGHLIFILSHLGRMEEADRFFQEAVGALAGMDQNDLDAWIYLNYGFRFLTAGDLVRAEAYGRKANAISESLKLHHLLTMGCHLVSVSHLYMGNFADGLEVALRGIQIGEEKGYFETAHAWNWNDASFCATAMGRHAEAIDYGLRGLEICKDLHSIWSEAWAYHALQSAYMRCGDMTRAESYARKALRSVRQLSLPYDTAVMETGLASVLLQQEASDDVLELLQTAEKRLGNFQIHLASTRLLMARFHLMRGREAAAVQKLKAALRIGRKSRPDSWLVKESQWIIPLLVKMYGEDDLKGYLDALFSRLGSESLFELQRIQKSSSHENAQTAGRIFNTLKKLPPADLHVCCFGKFRLFRGNVEIQPQRWAGEKPRMLFKYFCYHYSRGFLSKDELMEFLWPEEDPRVTRKRLHVALTKLRRTLEPELTRGMSSSYLQRDAEAYRLDLGRNGYLDIEAFDRKLETARKERDGDRAFAFFLEAEGLYSGELFAQDLYVPWCLEAREAYKHKYLEVLDQVISGYRNLENWPKCVDFTRRYLAVEPYAEEIYQALMIFHNAMGNRSMIVRTYEQCKFRLEKELDCLLSEETTELYQHLLSF